MIISNNLLMPLFKYTKKNSGNPLIVAPTGAGKSVIVANIIDQLKAINPNERIIMLVHTKELIEQNAECYAEWFPNNNGYGICAAGLNRRDTTPKIIFGQIQTIKNQMKKIANCDTLIVDEAHWGMAESGTMYQKFIDHLKEINPNLRIIGLTATPFTVKGGSLLNNGIFTDIVYQIELGTLIQRGVLCEPISINCANQADLSEVKKTGKDFNIQQMFDAFHKDDVTVKALQEVMKYGANRKKWLLFCVNVAHAEEATEYLNQMGIKAACVTGDMHKSQRNQTIEDYKKGKYRALVNCDVLTTGFNVKDIDMIGMLRGTQSAGLWLQIIGRGMRTHPNKKNCLILDFGGNIGRFGAIDKIKFDTKKGKKAKDALTIAPVRICPNKMCLATNPVSVRRCKYCDTEFPRADGVINIDTVSAGGAILSTQEIKPNELEVEQVLFARHTKLSNKSVSVKVIYKKGMTMRTEFLPIGNERASWKVRKWFKLMCNDPELELAENPDVALRELKELQRMGQLNLPKKIYTAHDKYDTIVAYDFGDGKMIKV